MLRCPLNIISERLTVIGYGGLQQGPRRTRYREKVGNRGCATTGDGKHTLSLSVMNFSNEL